MVYLVLGTNTGGETVYYTGKAGQAFVSPFELDSFCYASKDAAQRRATMLNKGSHLHGIHFEVSEAK